MTDRDLAPRAGAQPAGQAGTAGAAGGDRAGTSAAARLSRLAALLRYHWLIGLLLLAGLLLRVLAQVAYEPALLYIDTLKYLYGNSAGSDPQAYRIILRGILAFGNLSLVAAVQHLLGLGMGAALYVILLRRGAGRWLAALAAAPVLLDAYQVQFEQMMMPDVWFEAMIVAAVGVLLWQPGLPVRLAAVAGLVLGTSALVRQLGEVLIVPVVVYLLVCGGGLRQVATRIAAFAVMFALPIVSYCSVSYATTGHFWLARGQSTMGRLTAAADCATLRLPADLRPLCPTPAEQANGPDWLEHSNKSPLHEAPIPAGANRATLVNELDAAIEHQQPLRVAASFGHDAVRLFALTRDGSRWVTPISRWQFQLRYPAYWPWTSLGPRDIINVGIQHQLFGPIVMRPLNPAYGGPARVDRPVAAFLRSYQLDGGYTPGPVFALFALAGVAGSVLALARRGASPRTRRLALACLLFAAAAAVLLLAADVFEFSWRYQLPAVITLPPAGLLGLAALASRFRDRKEPPAQAAAPAGAEPAAG